jgi:hypothetical protein
MVLDVTSVFCGDLRATDTAACTAGVRSPGVAAALQF